MAGEFRLHTVLELAQWRLESATARLQALALRRREAEATLAQLLAFQAEYRSTRERGLAQGLEADRLRDLDAFLTKLEQAIGLQRAEVERSDSRWQAEHAQWLELRRRQQALETLRQRHLRAQAASAARREQKQQDEFAATKAQRAAVDKL
jgi:flagellar FliJ protein